MAGQGIRALYSYEVASSTEWAFQRFDPVFRPNYFVDIDGFLEQKILAMEAYSGEIRPAPHPRSAEVLQAMAVMRGAAIGLKAAEAFEIIWQVG